MYDVKELVMKERAGEELSVFEYSLVTAYWNQLKDDSDGILDLIMSNGVAVIDDKARQTAKTLKTLLNLTVKYLFSVNVRGDYNAEYAFTSLDKLSAWMVNETMTADDGSHKKVEFRTSELDGLTIGDKCHVYGDGNEIYTIVDVFCSSPNSPMFSLSSGFSEPVVKCYKVTEKHSDMQ